MGLVDAFGIQITDYLKLVSSIKRNAMFFCQFDNIFDVSLSKPQRSISRRHPGIRKARNKLAAWMDNLSKAEGARR